MDGQRGSVISYERACSLLPQLRLGYSIISTGTGENFERIQPSVHRRHQDYLTLEQEDGTTIYSLPDYSLTVREELQKDGTIRLTPLTGAVAYTSRSWQELPEDGLYAACLSWNSRSTARRGKAKRSPSRCCRSRGIPAPSCVSSVSAPDPKEDRPDRSQPHSWQRAVDPGDSPEPAL